MGTKEITILEEGTEEAGNHGKYEAILLSSS